MTEPPDRSLPVEVSAPRPTPVKVSRPTSRRPRTFAVYSPFRLGLTAAVGVGLAYLLFRAVQVGHDTLVLLALALFLAAGLDPAVRRVQRLGLSRGLAVGVVFLTALLLLIGIGILVIPPLASQTETFARNLPDYIGDLQRNHRIAQLDRRFGLLKSARKYVEDSSNPTKVANKLLSVGTTIADSIFALFSLAILTLYFLAYLGDITNFLYRLTPRSSRERVSGIGDRIVAQIGLYVAGSVALSLLSGLAALVFLWLIHVPDPLALAFLVAFLGLAPLVGSAAAIVIVCTVAFIDSVPKGIATVVFFVVYAVVQRLFLTPRLLHPSVRISPAAAVIGVLAGYTTLGFVGFVVAIPTVAVITLLMREVVLPRQAAR